MKKWNILKKQGQLVLKSKSSGPFENYQIIHNKNVVYETTDYTYALKEMQKYSEEIAATAELKHKLMTYTENGFTVTVKGVCTMFTKMTNSFTRTYRTVETQKKFLKS